VQHYREHKASSVGCRAWAHRQVTDVDVGQPDGRDPGLRRYAEKLPQMARSPEVWIGLEIERRVLALLSELRVTPQPA
jgi:hypothetical protein